MNQSGRRVSYLFVTGCARSGTSVMAELLRSHDEIAMGRERYGYRYLDYGLPLNLFEKERFCRELQPGDSHHVTLQPYYEELYQRFDSCRYRGDKIPRMATDYGPLLASYVRPKVVVMLRNIVDVAHSFNRRAEKAERLAAQGVAPGWPPDRRSAAAVETWNAAMRNTLGVLDQIDYHLVVYEELFVRPSALERLFVFLDLPLTDNVLAVYRDKMRRSNKLEMRRRQLVLTSQEKLFIARNADFESYQRLLALARSHEPTPGTVG